MEYNNCRNYWSMTEGVWNCLIDEARTTAFAAAIKELVRPGDTVVDAGTGTGILAMVAARAGAKQVFAIENDLKNIQFLRATFDVNNLSKICTVIEGDATTCNLPENVDVIACEMVATGLIEELQYFAMQNLLRFAKPSSKFVLHEIAHSVQLVQSDQDFYGFRFPLPRYEYPDDLALQSKALSDSIEYDKVDFSDDSMPSRKGVEWKGQFDVRAAGVMNGIRIASESILGNGARFGSSFAYAYPLVLPVSPIDVVVGDLIEIRLSYPYSGGFEALNYSIKKTL